MVLFQSSLRLSKQELGVLLLVKVLFVEELVKNLKKINGHPNAIVRLGS